MRLKFVAALRCRCRCGLRASLAAPADAPAEQEARMVDGTRPYGVRQPRRRRPHPHPHHHSEALLSRSGHRSVSGRAAAIMTTHCLPEPSRQRRARQYGFRRQPVGAAGPVHAAVQEQSLGSAVLIAPRECGPRKTRPFGPRFRFCGDGLASARASPARPESPSPISEVETTLLPSDLISAVRRPLASAAAIA